MLSLKEKYVNFLVSALLIIYPAILILYIAIAVVQAWPLSIKLESILETIFHIVEIFFVAPIPIFILTGLQKYLKNVAFSDTGIDNRERLASLTQTILETNLTKYNFISVILSTFFIGLVEKVVINKDSFSNFRDNTDYIWALGMSIIGMLVLFFYLKSSKHDIVKLVAEANKANELNLITESERREEVLNNKNEMVSKKLADWENLKKGKDALSAELSQLEAQRDKLKSEVEQLRNQSEKK